MKRLYRLFLHWLGFRCGMKVGRDEWGEPKAYIRCPICMEQWVKPEVLEVLRTRGEL